MKKSARKKLMGTVDSICATHFILNLKVCGDQIYLVEMSPRSSPDSSVKVDSMYEKMIHYSFGVCVRSLAEIMSMTLPYTQV